VDISALRIFVEVMRHGSFASVAREHGMMPSSVSRTISSLEDELGIRLFQRNTRRLIPTEVAEMYFERIRDVVAELDRAQTLVREVSATPRGRLRVTAPVSWGRTCVVPLLPEFMAAYPELSIELLLEDLQRDLLGDRIDVAMKLGPLPDSTAVALRLCRTPCVVCASRRYLEARSAVIETDDIQRHDCLLTPAQANRRRWLFRHPDGRVVEAAVGGRCIVSDELALHRCAVAGMGIALLPRWLVWPELQRGEVVALLPHLEVALSEFETSAWLLYPSRSHLPLKVRVFVEFFKGRFCDQTHPWDTFHRTAANAALAG
jgi:DNA-binding transcriptional LysR family regulator